jgi:hypothetical protein
VISVGGVVQPPADPAQHDPREQPDRDAAHAGEHEPRRRPRPRERPGHHRRGREAVDRQRRPVVREVLALDDRHDPARHAEAPDDLRGRDGVGGGDDRAEHERDAPGHAGQLVRDDGHHAGGGEDEADGQPADRPDVALQLARIGEERRAVQQRRKEDEQHEVRAQRHGPDARHEAQREPAEHERDRVGQVREPREDRQRGDRREQAQDRELEVLHRVRGA